MSSLHLENLGDLLDGGYRFGVRCVPCQRGGIVEMEPLVRKLGRDHGFKVGHVLKCSRCGGKNVEVRLQAPTAKMLPTGPMG